VKDLLWNLDGLFDTFTFFDRTENMKTAITIRFKEEVTSLSSELEEL